jgi:hypothetical protein
MKTLLLILAFALPGLAQSELPEIGSLADIKGLTKFYVVADQADREKITKVLAKRPELKPVGKPDESEFFIEYRELSRDSFGFGGTMARGQMDVYVMRTGKKLIAWSDTATGGGFKSAVAGDLAGKLLKAMKKENLK